VIHFYERPDIPMMFDLSIDEGEVVNIAAQRPDEHRALFGEMMRYFELVGARIPKKNPSFDPEAYKASGTFAELQPYGPFEGKRPLEDDEK
jgi:hypothetical protein